MAEFWRKQRRPAFRLLLAGLSEAAATLPWVVLLYSISGEHRWAAGLPGAWLLLLTYLAAAGWEAGARPGGASVGGNGPGAEGESRSRRLGRVTALAGGTAAAYLLARLSLPADIREGSVVSPNLAMALMPAAAYLWYRGARDAAGRMDHGRVAEHFTAQFAGVAGAALFLMMTGAAAEPEALFLLFISPVLLFAAGLTLLAATREQSLRQEQAAGTGGVDEGKDLSPLLAWVVAALLGLTLLASRLLTVARLRTVAAAAGHLLERPLLAVLYVMALVGFWAASLVIRLWRWLSALLHLHPGQIPPELLTGREETPDPAELLRSQHLVNWLPYAKALLLLAAVALVALLVYRLERGRAAILPGAEEERLSLGLWRGLLGDLQAWWGRLLRKRHRPAAAGAPAVETAATLAGVDARALFRRLQAWGRQAGRPRRPGETPSRYARALAELSPQAGHTARTVTSVYNQARYAEVTPPAEAVQAAAGAMDELQAPGKS